MLTESVSMISRSHDTAKARGHGMDEKMGNVSLTAPASLITAAKLDAVRRGLKFQEWWRRAGEKFLADKPETTTD